MNTIDNFLDAVDRLVGKPPTDIIVRRSPLRELSAAPLSDIKGAKELIEGWGGLTAPGGSGVMAAPGGGGA